MDLGITGKRAAVAAASRGLGLATARALVAEGVQVAICGRDEASITEAARSIGAIPIVADVGTVAGAEEFVRAATAALGGIDILVVNGGGPPGGTFDSFADPSAYTAALEQSCTASIAMCLAAVPGMRAQGWGRILAITSTSVREPIPGLILSNTARSAFTSFLKTMAGAVGPDGVTVNSLQPGLHATDRLANLGIDADAAAASTPVRAVGRPEDFGATAAFLCSDQARYITGAAVPIDGGRFAGLQ